MSVDNDNSDPPIDAGMAEIIARGGVRVGTV
jgi:hypothetical protein